MRLKLVGDYLVYLVVRLIVCVIQALPIELCQRIAKMLAVLACDVFRIRIAVVDDNIRHAFPDWTAEQRRRVAREMFEHLVLLICEMTHVPRKIRDTNWHQRVKLTNIEAMVAKLLEPRPKVVLTGHFGNFEVGGYMCALLGFPTHTVVRPLDNPFVDRFLTRFRLASGQRILPKQGSASEIQDLLKENGALGLLGDQAAGPKGCRVEFCNRETYVHKAIALFALVNKAPLLVTTTCRRDRPMQFEITLEGQFDPLAPDQELASPRDLSQWYCHLLEAAIRRRPEQYWWVHRLWKDTLIRKNGKWILPESERKRKRRKQSPEISATETAAAVVPLPDTSTSENRRKSA